MTEEEAVKIGLIIRDTSYISMKDSIFPDPSFHMDSLKFIPYTNGKLFDLKADLAKDGHRYIPVFEVSASFKDIYSGMDDVDQIQPIKDLEVLQVGSINKMHTNGNW